MAQQRSITRSAGRSASAPIGDHRVDGPRYEPIDVLAEGGQGVVYRGSDRLLERDVALKFPRSDDVGAHERFLNEAKVAASLEHPSIVPVYDSGEHAGSRFYVMRLLHGESLTDAIEGAATTRERMELVPTLLSVADAVAYAHGKGIIHRDLKPDNIRIGGPGEVFVLDWGLAQRVDETAEADGAGTPRYMAPEQACGDVVDARVDVYAIGGILYWLLSGAELYSGVVGEEVQQRVIAGPPEPLDERDAPRDLVHIANRCLARDPTARYPSMADLAKELRNYQTGRLISDMPYTRWQLIVRWARRHRALLAVSAVALAVVGVVAAISVREVVRERDVAIDARRQTDRVLEVALDGIVRPLAAANVASRAEDVGALQIARVQIGPCHAA